MNDKLQERFELGSDIHLYITLDTLANIKTIILSLVDNDYKSEFSTFGCMGSKISMWMSYSSTPFPS